MKVKDKWIFRLLIGFIIQVSCFCTGWWLFFAFNLYIPIGIILGLIFGIIMNILYLSKIISKIYDYNYFLLGFIYFLYTVGMFGFFMGVPVFNLFLGPIAGWYIGKRSSSNDSEAQLFKRTLRNTNIFCLSLLLLVCISSAVIALSDPTTASNLEGMLNLSFKVTQPMIITLIIVGGCSLLIIQYLLTKIVANKTFNSI